MQSEQSPSAIRIIREGQRLELDWADGHRSDFEGIAVRWLWRGGGTPWLARRKPYPYRAADHLHGR